MFDPGDVTVWVALWGGLISFFSPCVLPLYPSFLSYVTGVSVKDLRDAPTREVRARVFWHSLAFTAGLSLVYFILGWSASSIGGWLMDYERLISQIGGVIVIGFGLTMVGWLKLDFLNREMRMELRWRPAGYLGSMLIGFVFGAGWTPCIGPVLGTILIMAAAQPTMATWYMLFFSIGFALPFIILGFFVGSTRWLTKYAQSIVKIGGWLMIGMGFLLFTGQLNKISGYLTRFFGSGWW
ncbi:MAG: cytochrome c biogenesis protein CcdA [Candidatus Carbobacillus sp.]|nr:cytochrome c biogenesis protein CcdA [Candidatus Carbobacillus sp.]